MLSEQIKGFLPHSHNVNCVLLLHSLVTKVLYYKAVLN